MAKKSNKPQNVTLTSKQFEKLQSAYHLAATQSRAALLKLFTPIRDLDEQFKYPTVINIEDYRSMFRRMGLATRIVSLWPEECWKKDPEVFENENAEDTEFETVLKQLIKDIPIFNFLYRADIMSGIGRYGGLLLGLDDGKDLKEPVEGLSDTGEKTGNAKYELLYLKPFDQYEIEIKDKETDINNPRYGHPKTYTVKYVDEDSKIALESQRIVHWTRILHFADNRCSSDIYGTPRMKPVYNNLLDVKKIGGGSAEMFYRGGYPGLSLELNPEAQKAGSNVEVDEETIKEQMWLYGEGMQRYVQLTGLTAKSLAPQVADPANHLDWQVKLIALSLGVPYRLLLGTEEAKLASNQDKKTWNARVARRQMNYLGPRVIRPFFDRLITFGILPEVEYEITWPDLDAPTDDDIAKIALSRTEAFAKYVAGGVNELIAPREYLTVIHKMTDEEVDAIEKAQEEFQVAVDEDDEEERQKGLEDDEKRANFKQTNVPAE